ncbi:hypothetical protein E2C01_034100 [Portunus trituberculatus]|uniref:Uncharacterized protein n=1 Tax=Portunus trituberculatus TaxID=210409 RepID=A0A5B7F5I8_PORTR|nr:hypothetical protein [Portunus trituberculatus]
MTVNSLVELRGALGRPSGGQVNHFDRCSRDFTVLGRRMQVFVAWGNMKWRFGEVDGKVRGFRVG